MSLSYCDECERIVEGNTTRVFRTFDLSGPDDEDGEYVDECDCGNEVTELPEE